MLETGCESSREGNPMDPHTMTQRLTAEFLGTFVLVFGGCGTAVLAAGVPDVGVPRPG